MPLIQVVDENDSPLYGGDRKEAQTRGLWHRIVRVLVEDETGRLLIQKRKDTVINNPGLWDNSVAGHVDADETYDTAAVRELEEEIGLTAPVQKIDYFKLQLEKDGKIFNRFVTVYKTTVDSAHKFVLQAEEVDEVQWVTIQELKDVIAKNPDSITHGLKHTVEKYYPNA
jgi:isopentenyldiphosphate isomerase